MKRDKKIEDNILKKLYQKLNDYDKPENISIAIQNLKEWFDLTIGLDRVENEMKDKKDSCKCKRGEED